MDNEIVKVLLADLVVPLLVLFLSPFILVLARRLVLALEDWLDLKWTQEQRAQVDKVVLDAVAYVEEQARKALKDNMSFKDAMGASKVEIGVDYLRQRGKELELDYLVQAKSEILAQRLEAKLFTKRVTPMIALPELPDEAKQQQLES